MTFSSITEAEALLAAGKGKKKAGKKEKKEKKEKKQKKKKDKQTNPKPSKKPKKDKGEKKKKKKNKGGNRVVPSHVCQSKIPGAFKLGDDVDHEEFKKGKLYTCPEGKKPTIDFILCRFGAEDDVQFWINGKTKHQSTGGRTEINCKPTSARNVDLTKCSEEAAIAAMEEFNFSPKEYIFHNIVPMPTRIEVTASCNPKYVSEPPIGGVLLLECDGSPAIVEDVLTYWKPSLTSVANFDTFNC